MPLAETRRPAYDAMSATAELARNFSTETTPASAAELARYRRHLQPGTSVYVNFLPGSNFATTIETAKWLKGEGFNPVPHLAARSIRSVSELDDNLARLRGEADVSEVLAIGGGLCRSIGPFPDCMSLLETGLLDKHGIARIGVAGHPEGSPDISEAALAAALKWKNEFARRTAARLQIVTQMCFDPQAIIDWDRMIRKAGNRLPIRVGMPGPASIGRLLRYAKLCGIGPSADLLTRQSRSLAQPFAHSLLDQLLRKLAHYKSTDPDCGIIGCHLYPLGEIEGTARWMDNVAAGHITLGHQVDALIGAGCR